MSKQSEAKEKQGYNPKPVPHVCGTCGNFESDMDWPKWVKDEPEKYKDFMTESSKKETNTRCLLGGFAVKKMGTCREWKVKL